MRASIQAVTAKEGGMPETVDILLATYNGEAYLHEQLDSIIDQSYHDWRLLIRDDCSTDDTLSIIDGFRAKFPGKIELLNNAGKNLGVVRNFATLLNQSAADYTMFCDQDDVWLPDKISTTIAEMRKMEKYFGNEMPVMIYTDLKIADENLAHIADSVWKYQKLNPHNGSRLNRLLLQNIPTGCTMMINRRLREIAAPIPDEAAMHDWWISLVTAAFGKSFFISEPTAIYRQHKSNVVGAECWSIWDDFLKIASPSRRSELTARREILWGMCRRQAKAFMEKYKAHLPIRYYKMIQCFAYLDEYTMILQKYFILKYGFFYSNPVVTSAMLLFRW